MKIIILISLLGVVCSQDNPPVPVDELDINAYIGLWYNVSFQVLFKEQLPDPSVLLYQTKPEGVSPRVMSDTTKYKGLVIVPIITRFLFKFLFL